MTSSWTSRRPFHSLIEGWKTTEQSVFAASSLPLLGHVPGDRLDDLALLGHAELEVVLLLADDPGLAHDPDVAGQEQRPGIADAVGLQLLDLLDDPKVSMPSEDLGVDREHLLELLGRERAAAVLLEPLGEDGQVTAGELQAGGRLVAAEADQALGAGLDRLVEVEARDRPGRALAELVAQGHDDRRAGGRSRPGGWPRCR